MSCPRKLLLDERKPEVCLPRRPHAVLSRSQVLTEKRKWRRTWKADEEIFIMSFQNACGRLGRQTSARTKTSARLKITFVDMTYPKGWTGSLPLCPLIFSCGDLTRRSWVQFPPWSEFFSVLVWAHFHQ